LTLSRSVDATNDTFYAFKGFEVCFLFLDEFARFSLPTFLVFVVTPLISASLTSSLKTNDAFGHSLNDFFSSFRLAFCVILY